MAQNRALTRGAADSADLSRPTGEWRLTSNFENENGLGGKEPPEAVHKFTVRWFGTVSVTEHSAAFCGHARQRADLRHLRQSVKAPSSGKNPAVERDEPCSSPT